MTDTLPSSPGLLPAGLADLLPPQAEAEARSVDAMLEVFARYGYQRVKPPLLEFEETLLVGSGEAVAEQTFRVMDPQSRRMMALRADITPQIARIASTRLAGAPRPLRLCYAGACLRVAGQQPAPDRQVSQAGIELIGPDSPAADAELVAVAAEALAAIGLRRVSFDLTMPRLVGAILDGADLSAPVRLAVARALDRKDAAVVRTLAGPLADTLHALLLAGGRPERALQAIAAAPLHGAVRALGERLAASVEAIAARVPALTLTVDPVESRGFRYHTGVCMTVFAPGRHEELGRGGRYHAGLSQGVEPACGMTLYADAVLRAAPTGASRTRIYVVHGEPAVLAAPLRAMGHATVLGLALVADPAAEARRLHCTAWFGGGTLHPLMTE